MQNVENWWLGVTQGYQQCHSLIKLIQLPVQLTCTILYCLQELFVENCWF